MKALTLREPWASLVAIGAKRIETRSRSTSYRGPIAIHASKGFTEDQFDAVFSPRIYQALQVGRINPHTGLLDVDYGIPWNLRYAAGGRPNQKFRRTRGCVIATAKLIDCFQFTKSEVYERPHGRVEITSQEFAFGDFAPGRFGWVLADIVRLPEPIPANGALGLWEWEPPVELRGAA